MKTKIILAIAIVSLFSLNVFGQKRKQQSPPPAPVPWGVADGVTDNGPAFASATGHIELGAGTYAVSSALLGAPVRFSGVSTDATTILVTGAGFTVTARGSVFEHLSIKTANTSGTIMRINLCQGMTLENVWFSGGYDQLVLSNSIITHINRCGFGQFGHIAVQILNGNDYFLSHCNWFGAVTAVAGIESPNISGIWLDNNDVIYSRMGAGLLLDPGLGQVCEDIHIASSWFDNNQTGIVVRPQGGFVNHIFIDGCHLTANIGDGLDVDGNVDGVHVSGGSFAANGQAGAVVSGGAQNITFDNVMVGRNSAGNQGANNGRYPGIEIGAGSTHCAIRGCRIGQQDGSWNTGPVMHRYAVQLDGNNGYCMIVDNDLSLNLSAIYNANVGGSNNLIANNLE